MEQYIHYIKYFCIILFVISIDQISKNILLTYFQKNDHISSIPIFFFIDFTPVWNHGVGFGLFQKYKYANYIFIFVNIIVMLYFLQMFFRDRISNYFKVSLSLIIGGGAGNILDRIFKGAVFDFIYLNYKNFSFPVFNVADLSISLGAFLILISVLFFRNIEKI